MEENEEKDQEQKKRNFSFKAISPYLFWIILTAILTYSVTNFVSTGRLPWQTGENQAVLNNNQIRQLNSTFKILNGQALNNAEGSSLVSGALNGMTRATRDPYTQYFSPETQGELDQTISSEFEGIGATVGEKDGQIVIVSPMKDSPAEKAGLKANDVIVSVNGKEISGKTVQDVVDMIRGKANTTVNITIKRGNRTQDFSVKRDKIAIDTVFLEENKNGVARIAISSFSENTPKELKEKIQEARQKGAKAFVLDLRNNPGGVLQSAIEMASYFLDKGQTVVQVEDKQGNKEVYKAKDVGFHVSEPVSVLINEGSASASEILTAALMENLNIPVVGTTSFGKGTVQSIIPYGKENNGELKVTVAKWLTPKGNWINKKGIQPTKKVDLPDYTKLNVITSVEDLKIGQKNDDILNLQRILFALGYLNENRQSSFYDQDTIEAVQAFQKEENLTVTRSINEETAVKLMERMQEKIQNNDQQAKIAEDLLQEKLK